MLIALMFLPCVDIKAEDQPKLTKSGGVFHNQYGHTETYYNLPMNGVVKTMRNMGFSEEDYPYNVREDGAKCLGNLVIVAADLSVYPRGSIVNTSFGLAIVCDTGTKVKGRHLDLALDF